MQTQPLCFRCTVLCTLALASVLAFGQPPIQVGPDGRLLRDGLPFRAVGVNYSDAFERVLLNPSETSYEQGFADLKQARVPFVRFMATAFWPSHLEQFNTDREAYLTLLDGVVASAEDQGIGLVPSLFWSNFAVPDLVGEPVSAWGDPNSDTIAFMLEYTETIVSRYVNSPAIWAWEFGNERSLDVDLPNADQFRPPVNVSLGTPASRDASDELTSAMVIVAFDEFAAKVRELDAARPITTGNSLPRNFAEDIRAGNEWQELDSELDFQQNVALMNPDPMDMASVHVYPYETGEERFSPGNLPTIGDLVEASMEAARLQDKALFLGEFGANDGPEGAESAAAFHDDFFQAIVDHKVDLSAVWVYDRIVSQDSNTLGWNITPNNSRSYVLDLIQAANEAFFMDSDGDGIPDIHEDINENGIQEASETNPNLSDTDGDGLDDGFEIALGSDPLDSGDAPTVPLQTAPIWLGLMLAGGYALARKRMHD